MYPKRQKWKFPLLFSKPKRLFIIMTCMIGFVNLKTVMGQEAENRSMQIGLECVPAGAITIKDFRDPKAPKKDWRIVVGRDFKYIGIKESAGAWTWSIGGTNKWNATFTPKDTGTTEYEGIGIIPKTNLPLNNSDFGSTRGKVEVSNAQGEKGTADVKVFFVFFIKNDTNKVHSMTEPNWFYYWKQSPLIQNLLTIPGISMYNDNTCTWNTVATGFKAKIRYNPSLTNNYPNSTTYGKTYFGIQNGTMEVTNDLQFVCPPSVQQYVGTHFDTIGNSKLFNLDIGVGCGFVKELFYGPPGPGKPVDTLRGIHVLHSLVAHETEHMRLKCEIWQHADPAKGIVPGFSNIWDFDNDGYKDSWENLVGSKLVPIGTTSNLKNFDPLSPDTYNNAYNQALLGTGLYSAGTEYEEWRCYNTEAALIKSLIDVDDWSFDPTNVIQGKQWK